jgi:peroxiredoxin
MDKPKNTLKETLSQINQTWLNETDDATKQKFADAVTVVAESDLVKQALNIGDHAPDFVLNNAVNHPVQLSSLLHKGPVILTWYRGGWCPYCNLQLRFMQQCLAQFTELGASLVALTPELPDQSLDTKEKNELAFEVLTDFNNQVARKFGIVYTLHDALVDIYNGRLEKYNGVNTNEIPLPATYLIDQQGLIRYAYLNPNYKERAEPDEILAALQAISR